MRAKIISILLVLAILLTGQTMVRAAPPTGLQMQVKAAYQGVFKYGEWLPILVTLENDGADFTGEVQVQISSYSGAVTFAAPAVLPTHSRKQVTLYVTPNNYSRELTVALVHGQEEVLRANIAVQPLMYAQYLIGVVTEDADELPGLTGLQLAGRPQGTMVVAFPPDELASRAEGLRSFNCLVLNDLDSTALTQAQKDALIAWVGQGGRLVIGGGITAAQTMAALPESLLPVVLIGTQETRTLEGLEVFANDTAIHVPGPFVISTASVVDSARILVDQEGMPLIVERTVGEGTVDYVALDLASSPFDYWNLSRAFWQSLLQPGAAFPSYLPPDLSPQQTYSGQLGYALTNLPSLDLPSLRWLALVLLAYIILVGPANYLVLRRWRRLEWAWVTIPLLTVAFSAGAFGVGYILRGSDLILHKISIIHLVPGAAAEVRTYVGLFSPTQTSYDIAVDGRALLSPLSMDSGPWGVSGTVNTSFLQSDPGIVRGLGVNQWAMQSFTAEFTTNDIGELKTALEVQGEHVVGQITNRTGYTLRDAVLAAGTNLVHLGDIEPGAQTTVNLALTIADQQQYQGMSVSYLVFREAFEKSGPGGPDRTIRLRRAILDGVFPTGYWRGSGKGSPGLIFLAWLDEDILPASVAGSQASTQKTGLIYTSIPVTFGQGEVSIAGAFLNYTIVEQTGNFYPSPEPLCGDGIFSGVLEYQLPMGTENLKIETINLRISGQESWWTGSPRISLYDWQERNWQSVETTTAPQEISNAGRYVHPTARIIHLKIENDTQNSGGCLYVQMNLKGVRP
ncbi:MAG: hypothetical protein NUW24_06015 [Anaerolineae bacterium]|nr:hypothetical protein [Anaerolineae bacterium]MDH7473907.1 hypothetical protein [Anaerolineae bacterium]